MAKFAASLSNAQIAFARKVEAAGLTTFSQAVKAFEREDDARISTWKRQLAALATYVASKDEAEALAHAEDAVRFPAPVVEETPAAEEVETVTVRYQSFGMDMTAATSDADIEQFVSASEAARFDGIDEWAIGERAARLACGCGFLTSSNTLLTDADEIEAYLLMCAREDIQADIDARVSGLIAARNEAFGLHA